jgi:O-antigen/teichoic acid export membrane protein
MLGMARVARQGAKSGWNRPSPATEQVLLNGLSADNGRALTSEHREPDGENAGSGCAGTDGPEVAGGSATPPRASPGIRAAGERAVTNTLYRSVGAFVGRLASLALFAEMARKLGQSGLGAFVFAIAYLGFVMVAVDLGLDRYMLRAVVRDRRGASHMFFSVLALKLALAVPLFAVGLLGVHVLGYSEQATLAALALAPGVLADSFARTQISYFMAHERGGPPAIADAVQRILSAALGIAALRAGYGVVAVAVTYSIGSSVGVLIGFVLLHRTIGVPVRAVSYRRWRALAAESIPFAIQDTFGVLLARMDTLILALIAAQAAVGRYGAVYRLFESTFLITYPLAGSFSAMYTYLGPHSNPPVRFVFQQSLKLAVVILTPLTIAFAVLARPICQLIYGTSFGSAALPLRILAPAVLLMSIVTLCVALVVSQANARQVVFPAAGMAALNLALNLILIPLYRDSGAAAAMLATEVVYAAWMIRLARRAVGSVQWPSMLSGGLVAGVAMAAVTLPLREHLLPAVVAGGLVYLIVLITVERIVSPLDVSFAVRIVRQRLPGRTAG